VSNTKIQVKRSVTNSTVTGLANGELAYTSNGTGTAGQGLFYVGDPGGSSPIVIGGKYNFGTLTANQAIVTNATSYVDKILTANMTATNAAITVLYANGITGVAGNVLCTNASGGIYWGTVAAGGVTITIGDGLTSTQSPLTTSGTMSVNLASSAGLQFTSGALGIKAANGVTLTAGGLNVQAGNGVFVNAGGVHVNTTWLSGQAANSASYVANSGISSAYIGTLTANSVTNCPNTAISSAYIGTLTANAATYWAGANSVNSAQFVISSGALTHNTSGVVQLQDLTLTGNLTVSGVLTTIDTDNMKVKDNFVFLGDGISNTATFTDTIDTGIFVATGNTNSNYCSGFARIAASSTNTNPYFKLFSTVTVPNSTIVNTSASTGTLQSYLAPYGVGGAFVVNSSAMAFTANSTVSLSLTANTFSLTAGGLAVTSLAAGTDGQVLTMNNTTVAWGALDGGTF
jgi:hypothetical protein